MEQRMKHPKKKMKKLAVYAVDDFTLDKHNWICHCECSKEVVNLMGDKRVWTRVQFGCGEQIKINCQLLTKL